MRLRLMSGSAFLVLFVPAFWAMELGVVADPASPVAVGNVVRWYPYVESSDGPVWYRFRVRVPGESQFRMARDFSPNYIWDWIPIQGEGAYEVEVTARLSETGETSTTVHSYNVVSRISGDTPAISRTPNELVHLYSAPPCQTGSRMTVTFTSPTGERRSTAPMDCVASRSMNSYLAGLRPETEYKVQHTIHAPDGSTTLGPELQLTTGALPFNPPPTRPLTGSCNTPGVLLQNRLFDYSIATDMCGNVIWYIAETLQYLTRPLAGGQFLALIENHETDDTGQLMRVIDLAGNTILETNAARINEQLDSLGRSRITSFHHEARRLPNGKFLVLAGNEKILTDIQGEGDVPVIGDMILLLNADLEVEWVWDGFDHLDNSRKAILDEKCIPRQGGCPVMRLATLANDWLHGNSLAVTPDGGILYSARHQDWIIKIDFANGTGSGAVLWRLGKGGDFQILSDDPDPWFSHQHDASIVNGDGVLLFDNGNTRYASNASIHSRGQILTIDESARTARLTFNADLGGYALALGSAQQLPNGNYHFNAGWLPNMLSQALEYDSSGALLSQLEVPTAQYRSFRMIDIYTPE